MGFSRGWACFKIQCLASGAFVAMSVSGAVAQQQPIVLDPVIVESNAVAPVVGYVAKLSATGSKTNSSLLENPQSVTVVTRDQYDAQGARSVAEALRYEAGIVPETRIGDRFDNVFIRGFGGFGGNANYIQFWDNLRLPRGVNYANPSVDPYLLDRIEILRGPASILYGQNNPGGLVNLVSKRPTEKPFHEIFTRFGNNNRIEGGFDLSGPLKNDGSLLYRLIGLGRYAETDVDYNKSERQLIAPSVTWKPALGTKLTINASYDHDPFSFQPNWLPAVGTLQANPNGQIPRDFFSGNPNFNTYDRKQSVVGYEFEHQVSDVWTVRSNLRYMHIDSVFKAVSVSGPTGYGAAGTCGVGTPALQCLTRSSTYFVEKLDSVTIDNQAEAKFNTGAVKHTGLLSVDYQWSSGNALSNNLGGPGGTVANVNYNNPSYAAVAVPAIAFSTDQTRKQLGLYAQDQIRWDNWAFVVGVRHDDSKWDNASRTISTGALSAVARPSDSAVTWRAGATYLFVNGLAPYVNYSTSFEPTLGTDYAGVAFTPTTGKQIEGGLKYQPTWFNGYFLFSLYDLRQRNVLVPDAAHLATALCTATGSPSTCQMQVGEVTSRGFEISGRTSPMPGLDLVASYSRNDISITQTPQVALQGKTPVGAPQNTASLWADYTFLSGAASGFGFGGGVRYVGSTYGDNTNTAAMVVPAFTLADIAVHYDLAGMSPKLKGWKVALNVNNVFDKNYVSGCASTTQCFYGAGRNIMGTVRFRW